MQTFLPYADFTKSAKVLDRQRLGKQRVEALQILNALAKGPSAAWFSHPAVKMWSGHSQALCDYGLAVCGEWIQRGYLDTVTQKLQAIRASCAPAALPGWLGNPAFHTAHQSNLLRKSPEWYRPFFGNEVPDDLPYVWPTKS